MEDLHNAVKTLHINYFHSNVDNLFDISLGWFLPMIYLSKDNLQEERQEVINIYDLV